MKKIYILKTLLVCILFLSTNTILAQKTLPPPPSSPTITGDNTAHVNDVKVYTAAAPLGVTIYAANWTVVGGTISSQNTTSATIQWTTAGLGSITYNVTSSSAGVMQSIYTVTVTANAPATPDVPTVQSQDCTSATLESTGVIPTGEMWYWQGTTKYGTSTAYPATSTYTANASGTYRLRAKNLSTGVWSTKGSIIIVTLGSIGGDLWYKDDDLDGKGDPNDSQGFCSPPTSGNWVQNNNDLCPGQNSSNANGCQSSQTFSNENYIYTIIPQKKTTDVSTLIDTKDAIRSITYIDGLGRAKQTIDIMQSRTEKDIVTHVSYDHLGRQTKQYLPYPEAMGDGLYKTNALGNTNSYYYTNYTTDFPGQTSQTINAYSEKVVGDSPLARIYEQTAPGTVWKKGTTMLAGGYSNGHTTKYAYSTNAANTVRKFDVGLTSSGNYFIPSLTGGTSYYNAGELVKEVVKNENWEVLDGKNNTEEQYKDKMGRIILKRTYSDVDINGDADTNDAGEQEVAHDTYYIYDKYENLSFVISPKVTLANGVSPTELSELCYQYVYDNRNRIVEKKTPGKDWEYIIYDDLNRPVLAQDVLLRADDKWLFTKFDQLGRVVYTGIYDHGSTSSRVAMQTTFNSNRTTMDHNYEEKVTSGTGFENSYYTNNDFPSQNIEVLTVNYYDDYTFNRAGTGLPGSISSAYETLITEVHGLTTGSRVKVLDQNTDYWITTVTYYNNKEQVIYVYTKNEFLNTTDIVSSQIDFAGKVLETKTTHTNTDDAVLGTQTITDTFTYDHAGRLLSQTQSVSNGAVTSNEKITENTYNEMGVLTRKGVGGDASSMNRLQTVDYAYNIRGWLKKINDDAFNDNDLFNFSLSYHEIADSTKKLYNGNISQVSWNTLSTDSSIKTYTYSYDAMNRLISAIDNTGKYNLHYINYDLNGNIHKLQRQGHVVANPNLNNGSDFGMMDNLVYEYYTESNKLKKVTDSGNANYGFKDGANLTTEYTYDLNGNLSNDANKNNQSLVYNHLGLVKGVTNGNGPSPLSFIDYVYDAVGNKLEKKVLFVGGGTTITRYAGSFVYKKVLPVVSNGSTPQLILEYFSHAEGYVKPEYNSNSQGENLSLTNFTYIYQYKDHLENVRLTYSDSDDNGSINATTEIIEESNYYPFGLLHKGYNNVMNIANGNSTAQKFKYNSKEYEDALGVYEMDVRNLDPALGRWLSIDPVTHHSMSTYNGFDNNPVYYADPSGADSDERIVLNRFREGGLTRGCATGNCSSTETITKETEILTLTSYTQVNYKDGTSTTIEGESESFDLSSKVQSDDGEVLSSEEADVSLTVSNKITGSAKVRSYPKDDGNVYKVPLYKVTLSGKDIKGKEISEDFDAIRFGVQYYPSKGIGPKVVGLAEEQTRMAEWDQNTMRGYGSWRIKGVKGNHLIHFGAADPNKRVQGNTGCIAICGIKNYGGKPYFAWTYFTYIVEKISGKKYEKAKIRVNFQGVTKRPSLIKL